MINYHIIVEYLAFLFLMHAECRYESKIGQLGVSMVVVERNMEMLDPKQFNCFSESDVRRFRLAVTDNKMLDRIVSDLKTKITAEEFYFWTLIYVNRDIIRLLNTDRRMYYMTHSAWEHTKRRFPKWVKTLSVVESIDNHVFLKSRINPGGKENEKLSCRIK